MPQAHALEFACQGCKTSVSFSVFDLDRHQTIVECPQCKKKYAFHDETLKRQIKKFVALCKQIKESEEILANTAVGVDVGERHIKIPYNILLTRLNSPLALKMGDTTISLTFRIEPVKGIPQNSMIEALNQ